MRKFFINLRKVLLLVLCLSLMLTSTAAAVVRNPKPIEVIPIEEIAPTVEGQHHYLLLCADGYNVSPKNFGNTDGIVIVTLDTRAKRVMLTSIIRDALVYRLNKEGKYGIGRINYIAKDTSPENLCQVISQHINVKIDKYIMFDFSKVGSIVDACGGVEITINNSEAEYMSRNETGPNKNCRKNVKAGTYWFDGWAAVKYMRIRKAGSGGDFTRTRRVRTVLSTLADHCRTMTFDEAKELLNIISDNTLLTNMSAKEMMEALEYAYSLRNCTVEELRLPPDGAATPITYNNMSVQEIDWEKCRESMAYYLQNSFLVIDDEDDD